MKLPEGKTLEDIAEDVLEGSRWIEPHKLLCNGCGHFYMHHQVGAGGLDFVTEPTNACYECDEICYSAAMWKSFNIPWRMDHGGKWWHPIDEFDYLVNEARKMRMK